MYRLSLLFSYTTLAYHSVYALRAVENRSVDWFSCEHNGTLPYTCGTLSVPLDYTDATSNLTIDLSLVRINATREPRQGSVLFNPGGPGIDATDFIKSPFGPTLFEMIGGYHDLVVFDTRGTGNTLPFSCFNDSILRNVNLLQTPATTNTSDTALGGVWAGKQVLEHHCYQNARDVGELIGTTFVARDMMQIVDALNEDGMLRYFGLSYGTVLGATVSAMFPDRVDKVALDGILNPTEYYYGWDTQTLTDADATWSQFFRACVNAAAGKCALARRDASASDLEQEFIDFLYRTIKYNPIVVGSSIIDYGLVKNTIQPSLSLPSTWPDLAAALNGLMSGNASKFLDYANQISAGSPPNFMELNSGIRCSDNRFSAEILEEIRPLVRTNYEQSYILGDFQAAVRISCARWRMRAKERYGGGFENIRTKNPLLIIGNTFDPLTPLVSARNLTAGFLGSVLLQHDGSGHCSVAQPSVCTANAISAYFVNGTLPEAGTKCEPDVPLFG